MWKKKERNAVTEEHGPIREKDPVSRVRKPAAKNAGKTMKKE